MPLSSELKLKENQNRKKRPNEITVDLIVRSAKNLIMDDAVT